MATSVDVLEEALRDLVSWTPGFERGYDWGRFYSDNQVPPVLCHGTRSREYSRLRKYGLSPPGENSPPLETWREVMGFLDHASVRYGIEIQGLEAFRKIGDKLTSNSWKTCLSTYPGISWCYANMGGENVRNVASESRRYLEMVKPFRLSRADRLLMGYAEGKVRDLEEVKDGGEPALVLVQTDLGKFGQTGIAPFFDRDAFEGLVERSRELMRIYPGWDEGKILCSMFRGFDQEHAFRITADDEVNTREAIPPEDIKGIIFKPSR